MARQPQTTDPARTNPAETRLAELLTHQYNLPVHGLTRIPAGTTTDNFRADTDGGPLFVKVYRHGTNLAHEKAILAVAAQAGRSGLLVPALLPDRHGHLLSQSHDTAMSVWQWYDSDNPPTPLTPDVAHELGREQARLHLHLANYHDGSWPVAQPHYRRHTLNQIRQRFTMLARHIESQSELTSRDALNLDRILRRLNELRHVPGLLESATPPRYALVHGDFVRPNLLIHKGQLQAVIDMRLKYDEPVRELGRLAFDVETIAKTSNWLEVAEAALTGYQAEGGIVAPAAFYGCARLALLHSLCSTYPIEELYLDPPPAHLHADLTAYWANRATAVTAMIEHLDEADAMVTRLARLPRLPQPAWAAAPMDPRRLLPVAATARAHLRELITQNAQAAGVKALLQWGSEAASTADPLSDLDLIAVTDEQPGSLPPQMLVARLFEPAPLLFSRTVTHNGPRGGFYRGVCAQVAGIPVWVDVYLWPASAAVIPTDTTVVFDHIGLPQASETFWELLDADRADPDGNPHDEPGSGHLLEALIAAKRLARPANTTVSTQPSRSGGATAGGDGEAGAVPGIEALDWWVSWCRQLARTGWNTTQQTVRIVRRTTKSTAALVHGNGSPVMVKALTGADPYQAGLFATETAVYETLAAQPAPVPVPQRVVSGSRYLVISEVDGVMLHPDRYPHEPLPADNVRSVLRALAQFSAWTPDSIRRDTTAADLLHAKATGMLTRQEADAYQTLRGLCRQWCLAHGDAIPSNFLIGQGGGCTLVDFENTGWHLPGYDYAVLRSVLALQPDMITVMIDEFAAAHAGNAAYTVNLIAAAAREVRLHSFFAPDPTGYREQAVTRAWAHARHRLRNHPATTSTSFGATR